MKKERQRSAHRSFVVAALVVVALGSPAVVAQPGTSRSEPDPSLSSTDRGFLVVATKPAPPFSMKDRAGDWRGISIELWRLVAADLGVDFEIRETGLDAMLDGVAAGEFDVGVAAITITAEREARLDFSHPFFDSGLAIAVVPSRTRAWLGVFRRIVSPDFLGVLLGLLVVLAGVGAVVWLFERRRNPEQFGGGAASGLGSGLWWSAVTMTTVGYGDKAPLTFGGRIVALVWMFLGLVLISTFTAALTSALTVGSLTGGIAGPEDLPGASVAAVAGTTGGVWLEQRGIGYRSMESPGDALSALAAGEVDAVVHDGPILSYLGGEMDAGIELLPHRLDEQPYGFVLPQGSPLREAVNRSILAHLDDPAWETVISTYLGD